MFRSMQKKLVVRMRAVTISAAIMAIFVSAFAMSPEINHRALSAQPAIASVTDTGVIDDGPGHVASESNCHLGHSCILVIMPGDEMALTRFEGAAELPQTTLYKSSRVEVMPFPPPRILSLV